MKKRRINGSNKKTINRKQNLKKVQIIGMFNTGSNLVSRIINELFNVNIHNEGHSLWWKHSVVSPDFFDNYKDNNTLYVVVAKNPYWWFHSVYKAPYGITIEEEGKKPKKTQDIINKNIVVNIPPKNKHKYNKTMMTFDNLPKYWSSFYSNALSTLPPERTIVIRYVDVVNNINKVINSLKKKLPLKKTYALSRNPSSIKSAVHKIMVRPSKSHGNPRFGQEALDYYQLKNIPKLFTKDTFEWISTQLDKTTVERLQYEII